MKTDEEFLAGIYQKASQIQAGVTEEKIPLSKKNLYKTMVPVLMACVLGILIIPLWLSHGTNGENREKENDINTVGIGPDTASVKVRGFSVSDSCIVMGMITKIDHESGEKVVDLDILESYQGDITDSITFTCGEDTWPDALEKGKEGLFYLEISEDGYVISEGDYSLYQYVGEENGEKIFKAKDGTTLSSGILTQQEDNISGKGR